MNNYLVNEEFLQSVLDYLANRPYKEVFMFVDKMKAMKPYKPEPVRTEPQLVKEPINE